MIYLMRLLSLHTICEYNITYMEFRILGTSKSLYAKRVCIYLAFQLKNVFCINYYLLLYMYSQIEKYTWINSEKVIHSTKNIFAKKQSLLQFHHVNSVHRPPPLRNSVKFDWLDLLLESFCLIRCHIDEPL